MDKILEQLETVSLETLAAVAALVKADLERQARAADLSRSAQLEAELAERARLREAKRLWSLGRVPDWSGSARQRRCH